MLDLFVLLLFLSHGGFLPASSSTEEQFVFNGFKGANLSLDGTATVTSDGALMLTNGTNQLKGHAFYPAPLQFHRVPNSTAMESFSTAFVIGIVGAFEDLSSHGMVFVVARSRNFTSALPGQFLGLVNSTNSGNATNHLFAVEFDTILNSEFNDMSGNHVGININGLNSVNADNAGYYDDATGAFRNLSLVRRNAMQVWIDFDGETTQVNVTMAPLQLPRPNKPLLSTTVNLSSVINDDTAYVGFSSATGILFCRHYVLGWSFKMNGAAPALNITSLPTLPVTFPKPRSKTLEIVLPTAFAVLVVVVVATLFFLFIWRRCVYADAKEEWNALVGPHRFSYKDLVNATDGFSDNRLLGIGGFGGVYKGVLDSKIIAVKKVLPGSRQGMREFIAEVVSIGQLGDRNLVELLGYCRFKGELLLVYDYMPNGSLDKYLYDQNKVALSWTQRFRIIKGVASGLLYLHESWNQIVVHRDVKSSNVLLDGNMNARLSDFGLARLYDRGVDPQTTRVAGTRGYIAPELWCTGKPTPVTDVFSFGVLVLEVCCGRRPLGFIAPDGHNVLLLDWVQEHERQGTVLNTMDSRLSGMYDADEALKLGLMCAHPVAHARPGMRKVVQYMAGGVSMPEDVAASTYMSYTMLAQAAQNDLSSPISTAVSAVSLSGGR